MATNRENQLFREEEKLMNKVYKVFDIMSKTDSDSVDYNAKTVEGDAFEEHDSFIAFALLSKAKQYKHNTETLINQLYDKPYFSHVRVHLDKSKYDDNYFLSDCESLEEAIIHKFNLANADVVSVITFCIIPRNVVQLERDFATTNTRKTALFLLCFPERGMHNG